MNIPLKRVGFCIASFLSTLIISNANAENGSEHIADYRSDYQPEGWFFYKDPEPVKEIVKEEVIPETIITPAEQKVTEELVEDVAIDSKWLRINLPILLDKAQDVPTEENVRRYLYAQRIAMDKANVFSDVFAKVVRNEMALKEDLRRPSNNNQLLAYKRGLKTERIKIFKETKPKFGLFFFFKSDCEYCRQMVSEITNFKKRYAIDILPVSIDGLPLPNAPSLHKDTIYDDGTLTSMMPVDVTPTVYAFNKETYDAAVISKGFIGMNKLIELSLLSMKELNVINNTTYQASQSVKDILLIPEDPNKQIMINEDELYNKPDYLAEKLRQEFNKRYMGEDSFIPGINKPTTSDNKEQ
ncbi:hypothetical protein UA32_12685 [Photobacterium angustum]|uniref:Conjugal transfer protein TraF n=1 Tax=Photobacterium angustum TaxID=661 RepID=A0ABX5H158_PHOAN|nr:conjugal transfer protein TraF [Photobacterium angustum]KJG37800.1 hypothetical protein UA32_12685 [Photobacterium angustum]PSX07072.1 hypothetical protein C0W27_16005 [Photobacterium angustum]